MLKVAFCDDDQAILNEICNLLDRYRTECKRDIEYMAFQSPLDLLAEIEKGMNLDVLFLDVIMPGENGIEVAKEIREFDKNVKIIFLTASEEFAVQSYTVGAYFYQLKPIWEESFYRLMDSVSCECKREEETSLILRCKNGIARIDLDRLQYCEVVGRKLFFHLENGSVLESSGSLDELAGHLKEYAQFVRPHRSYLINLEYVKMISYKGISMENEAQIPIPRGKYTEIKDAYLEYAFERKQVFYHE